MSLSQRFQTPVIPSVTRLATLCGLLVSLVTLAGGCKRSPLPSLTPVDPARVRTIVDTPAGQQPVKGLKQVLGNGWYANVEVGPKGRIHLAWTEADVGDVFYAVLDDPQGPIEPEPVEVAGAVGSYLRLKLAPGGAPILSYYHQTDRTLRVAHRTADVEVMQAAGANVSAEGEPKKRVAIGSRPEVENRMGPGWVGEDVAFGDNVGMAGALAIGPDGQPHLAYYARAERMRYARRPQGMVAFGPTSLGEWELLDVDEEAGATFTMSTDLLVTEANEVVVSFCHWNLVDSQLKVAVLRPGERKFQVVETELSRAVDGWHTSIVPKKGGWLDIFSVASGEEVMKRTLYDPKIGRLAPERQNVLERPGPTRVLRHQDTVWMLTRGKGLDTIGEKSGVWLVRLPGGDPSRTERTLLDEGPASDPWIDLALTQDGRPVAAWTTADHRAMKLYVEPPAAGAKNVAGAGAAAATTSGLADAGSEAHGAKGAGTKSDAGAVSSSRAERR